MNNNADLHPSRELRWPISAVLALIAVLQLTLPERYILGPRYLGPAVELALVAAVTLLNPRYIDQHTNALRRLGLGLASAISLFNVYALLRMIHDLATGRWSAGALSLLVTGAAVWLTNMVVMGLWYWEHDLGGPGHRARGGHGSPTFLFPQMTSPEFASKHWRPMFMDYVYLSFTNASAFSPTDVLPLTRGAKLVMMVQSMVSLLTLVTVVARAINTL